MRILPQLNSVDLTMRAPKASQALFISLSSPYLANQTTMLLFAVHCAARQVPKNPHCTHAKKNTHTQSFTYYTTDIPYMKSENKENCAYFLIDFLLYKCTQAHSWKFSSLWKSHLPQSLSNDYFPCERAHIQRCKSVNISQGRHIYMVYLICSILAGRSA